MKWFGKIQMGILGLAGMNWGFDKFLKFNLVDWLLNLIPWTDVKVFLAIVIYGLIFILGLVGILQIFKIVKIEDKK